ncbi:hypothetical protein NEOLEDRAFT_1182132 [Neolentinus lepideus HHB14362 ss-1]|uniref:Uncharacterized protein n=1 Tax=Neolentinus lepideus HHB14362 ss-1 TaxID=1314782 RepID=A0A165PEC4_9AGAM|nr:hypothetical protein NEOLEDRAFT_1182132 [Neolentinus lepideus HHB14362 ss-1]
MYSFFASLSPTKNKRRASPLLEDAGIRKKRNTHPSPSSSSTPRTFFRTPSPPADIDDPFDYYPTPASSPEKKGFPASRLGTQSARQSENRIQHRRSRSPKKSLAMRESPAAKALRANKSLSPPPSEVFSSISEVFGVVLPLQDSPMKLDKDTPTKPVSEVKRLKLGRTIGVPEEEDEEEEEEEEEDDDDDDDETFVPMSSIVIGAEPSTPPRKVSRTEWRGRSGAQEDAKASTVEPRTPPRKAAVRMPSDWIGPRSSKTDVGAKQDAKASAMEPCTPPRKAVRMPSDWIGPRSSKTDATLDAIPPKRLAFESPTKSVGRSTDSETVSRAEGQQMSGPVGESGDVVPATPSPAPGHSRQIVNDSPHETLSQEEMPKALHETPLELACNPVTKEEQGVQTDDAVMTTSRARIPGFWEKLSSEWIEYARSCGCLESTVQAVMARVSSQDAKWQALLNPSNSALGLLSARSDMPWPLWIDTVDGTRITRNDIRDYVMSPFRTDTYHMTARERIHYELRKWLFFTFDESFAAKFLEVHRVPLLCTVAHVIKLLFAVEEEVRDW